MNFIEGIIYMIWRGIAIGVIISAPMGPVGILCVQRTLEKGRRTGFFTGIGATISDMFYCLLTGFGLSFIEEFLTRNHDIIQLIGSVVLIGFGIYLFKSNPSRKLRKPDEGISDKRNILNGFLFTFSNPLIIFLIIGLFARFNFFMPEIKFYHYVIGFLSIAAGALLWWWVVTFFVAKLRSHFNLRSMWLINKIIGSIIFIFAIVGIVTAVTAMCAAASTKPAATAPQPLYLNSVRGFGEYRNANDSTLIITASEDDTVVDLISVATSPRMNISFRGSNLHNAAAKGYRFTGKNGKNRVRHPAWGIIISDRYGRGDTISIKTEDSPTEETYLTTSVKFRLGKEGPEKYISEGMDFFTGPNAFLISFDQGRCSFMGGNRDYKPILSWDSEIEQPDSIGFFVSPGAKLQIEDIAIEYPAPGFTSVASEFSNPDLLHSYLIRSTDPREGIWKVFDRSLEENLLRMGGEYTVAIIRNAEGYEMYYLDGAKTRSDIWKPGMLKARLSNSGFPDIFDVTWVDATGETLAKDIKARYESPLFTFMFPYQSSTLRLRKITYSR